MVALLNGVGGKGGDQGGKGGAGLIREVEPAEVVGEIQKGRKERRACTGGSVCTFVPG